MQIAEETTNTTITINKSSDKLLSVYIVVPVALMIALFVFQIQLLRYVRRQKKLTKIISNRNIKK